ncbi:hypothetical protein [Chitinophaga ginsengisoli]|uniref:GLPGLI family protein n=1 Tax=Chitinophaga ginsengisoli TaxID=363837 RepID=A0A2P8FVU6_9BACT|nr:hypothetical protein [Chitinophaga ginsengisoli]PSL25858.1 hypothetical protein CLV42_11263 [Chitinophaga ginsengisoli]
MKKSFIAILLLTLSFLPAFSQDENDEYQKVISDFITCVKQQDKVALSKKIVFPLRREYPLPAIKNKQEFLNRYNEIFNDTLVEMITTSAPDKDWSKMGWRGLMLRHGQLWLNEEGKLIAVNYQSAVESKKRALLVEKERSLVHSSLKEFKRPVALLETGKFRIRIDDMGNGNYRYASWGLKNKQSDKPDLIIENGQYIPEGSGGNHRYEFKTNGYVYNCSVTVLGGKYDDAPAELTIYKGEKEILSQPATIAD